MIPLESSSHIEARIVCAPPSRGSHQLDWPEVEAVERVTVVAHESWGTRSATYEVASRWPVDIREGYTRAAIAAAHEMARQRIGETVALIRAANPDYMTPARY
jgi:hypothetical protein